MAVDSALAVRRAMLEILKADAALVALVPAARVYGQTVPATPTYPFTRAGPQTSVPIGGACVDGEEITVAVHGFALPRKSGQTVVETAEDFASKIGAAIAGALDRQIITLPTGRARVRWRGKQLLQDPSEADCFHTVQSFRIRAITA